MSDPIRHIVAIRFKVEISDAQIADLMAQLSALRAHLGGITDFQSRSNVSPEEPVVHGFGHLFLFDFVSEAARDAYEAALNDVGTGGWLERQVLADDRFELATPRSLSLLCLRLTGDRDRETMALLEAANATGRVLLTHTTLPDADGRERSTIRVAIGGMGNTFESVQS